MFYVYILHSETFDKYYVGSSSSPWNRLVKHNTSTFNTYTSKYRPWILKAVFKAGNTRGEAEKSEKFIKKQKSRNLLLKLIDPKFKPTGDLAHPDSYREVRVSVPKLRDGINQRVSRV